MAKLVFLWGGVWNTLLATSCKQIRIQERMERYVVLHSANVVE
jgi:hypothetical protein